MIHDFRGIFPALLTPMHEDESVDHESLAELTTHLLQTGVHGFYVGGSTAEAFLLTFAERMSILETVLSTVESKAPVISHVGAISTAESIRLAKHAETAGAAAISAVVPFYYKLSLREIKNHYLSIMASTNLPMIIYHYPGATGVNLTLDFYEEMAQQPKCLGVKFTSLNLFEMQQIRSLCGPNFRIFNGHDEVYASGVMAGCDGAIGSTFNIMPQLFLKMFELANAQKLSALPPLQEQANQVISVLKHYDVIAFEKYVSYLQQRVKSPKVRGPLTQFSDEERRDIRSFFEANGVLNARFDTK